MSTEVNWPLGNGEILPFKVFDKSTSWNDIPGLYIFAYQTVRGWHALYVGQAQSFRERLPHHERFNDAIQNGATHIHAQVVQQQAKRDHWEKMLIQNLQPPLNTQHR